jgi:putative redox protein
MHKITASIGNDRYQTTISNARHTLIADEPADVNGTDLGPTPQELLLMSLASCTVITLRMYADRKQMPVDAFYVTITSDMVNGTLILSRDISISGTITDEDRVKLMRIADACPVHKALTHPIEINTTLA